jgi:hypothetical protein
MTLQYNLKHDMCVQIFHSDMVRQMGYVSTIFRQGGQWGPETDSGLSYHFYIKYVAILQ